VRGVEDGSLAADAGIEAGDLLVEAGGRPLTDADDLFAALSALDLPFELKLVRGAEERTVRIGGGTTATGEA
jgi:S1-C subfamily serine protease